MSLGTVTIMSELHPTVGEAKIGVVHVMRACGGSGSRVPHILNLSTEWM